MLAHATMERRRWRARAWLRMFKATSLTMHPCEWRSAALVCRIRSAATMPIVCVILLLPLQPHRLQIRVLQTLLLQTLLLLLLLVVLLLGLVVLLLLAVPLRRRIAL